MQENLVSKAGAERVLFILATLARVERPVTMAELVEHTGLPKSTLYRQLALLKRWGFVLDSGSTYSPGPMCLPLAWGFDRSSFLVQQAHSEIVELSRNSGESIGLLVAVNNQAVCLDMVESDQPLRCSFVKGRGLPLYRGASAKALLAFMGDAGRRTVLEDLGKDPGLTPDGLLALTAQLQVIREQGYAVSDSEVDEGVWGVSAPVVPHGMSASAVVTLMAPVARVASKKQAFIDMTVRVASRISSRLQSL
jgi:DNA-binding IclR family transcriptional regulator